MKLEALSKSILYQPKEVSDIRISRFVELGNLSKINENCFALVGYPDNEGIQLNGGRTGAEEAPQEIRKCLYKMTPRMSYDEALKIVDLGNIKPEGSIEERHEFARTTVRGALEKRARVIGLGGGHDYGYCDGAGFLDVYKDDNPLIINFDAHLDVRPTTNGLSSGTPFYRLLEEFEGFDFLEIGLQEQCNSKAHVEYLANKQGKALWLDELLYSGSPAINKLLQFLEPYIIKPRPTFISIDMDAFSSAYAPGCSQVFPTGLDPQTVIPAIKILCNRLDVRVLSTYEASPPLDVDNRTSRLAAQLIHNFIFEN